MKHRLWVGVLGVVAGLLAGAVQADDVKTGTFVPGSPVQVPAMIPVSLDGVANATLSGSAADLGDGLALADGAAPVGSVSLDGVPFRFGAKAMDVLGSMRGVREPFPVLKNYLDEGTIHDNGRLVVKVPVDQYAALHVVAFARAQSDAVPRFTVRLGVFGQSVGLLHDERVTVPDIRAGGVASNVVSRVPVKLKDGKEGALYHIRVPLAGSAKLWELIASRLVRNRQGESALSLEFTRDVNVHVTATDPNEFTTVPAGHPSGVVILAATLEPSPVMVAYATEEAGHVFYENQPVVFQVTVSNRTDKAVKGAVGMVCAGPGTADEFGLARKTWTVSVPYTVAKGAVTAVPVNATPTPVRRGWFAGTVAVEAEGRPAQVRETSFAVLAPDTRKATPADSPFGTWEFWHTHAALGGGPDLIPSVARLMQKGGWRWTYGGFIVGAGKGQQQDDEATVATYQEFTKKYGVRFNMPGLPQSYQSGAGSFNETEFQSAVVPKLKDMQAKGYDNVFKVLHESRSSVTLVCRLSEFLGGTPYDMPSNEMARLDRQFENVKLYCAALKKADPNAKVVLINDYTPMAVEYMKRGFPHELFDVFGLEGANFMREPERNPDWMSILGTGEIMRRAKKQYGYEDKPHWTTEALYHGTNPGNLSLHKQAVIYAREAMIALANGYTRLAAAGILKDPSDDYHWSNWGAAGYCFRAPELNPKPSYAMMAWLTQVLDQARYAGHIETPNTSLHVLDFRKPDGSHVYPVWVVRGAQKVGVQATGKAVVQDCYGNPVSAAAQDGRLDLAVGDGPLYITGATVEGIAQAEPIELTADLGRKLLDFDRAEDVVAVETPSRTLESNWDFPRLKGKFATAIEQVDGVSALKVQLLPDDDNRKLLQRYVELKLAQPVKLEGQPREFALRVKGNGAWGRVMVEAVDAKGRIWTSNGNLITGNGGDPKGDSYVSFAGWQTLTIAAVGQYPGADQFIAWPRNYEWSVTNAPEYDAAVKAFEDKLAAYEEKKAAQGNEPMIKTPIPTVDKKGKPLTAAAKQNAIKAAKKKAQAEGRVPARAPTFRFDGIAAVDYPLTLTKVIVAMAPEMLYVDGARPVAQPVIWLDSLGVKTAADDQ